MAIVQNTFAEDIPFGYPGMEADGELSNIISRTLEGATHCAFGRPVFRGANDKGVTLVVSAALMGFALAKKGLPVTSVRAADEYIPGDTIAVKERGKLWVNVNSACADGAQVYVTAGGVVSGTSGGNTAAPGWVFEDTLSGAGLARIVRR